MWIIEAGGAVEIRANHPGQDILDILRKEFPGARILRSKQPCINQVNELLFALVHEEGEVSLVEVPVFDADGAPVLNDEGNQKTEIQEVPGPTTSRLVGNTHRLDGDDLVVLSPAGEEIGRFGLEVALDPAA